MLIPFFKMQAQGNDFVFLEMKPDIPPDILAKRICDRHFGVGADGLVYLCKSDVADAKMLIYNADGSRAEMCGSALRCAADHLLKLREMVEMSIETDSGIKDVRLADGEVIVNMGKPRLIQSELNILGFMGELVGIGNLHFIVFHDNLDEDPHLKNGLAISTSPLLPAEANVHFVDVHDEHSMSMKIWERGAGATLACGTGAASAVFAGINKTVLARDVIVNVPGGKMRVFQDSEGSMFITGKVEKVFAGVYTWRT